MSVLHSWFGWPDGGIWSNLVASAIWAIPTGFFAAKKIRKMHRHILQLHEHHGIESE
jgi:hypothetical protein